MAQFVNNAMLGTRAVFGVIGDAVGLGEDICDAQQLQALENANRGTPVALIHTLCPLWMFNFYNMEEEWPTVPPFSLASVPEFNDLSLLIDSPNFELSQALPYLRDYKCCTLFVSLLSGKLQQIEAYPDKWNEITCAKVKQDFKFDSSDTVRVKGRPTKDEFLQNQKPWELTRLSLNVTENFTQLPRANPKVNEKMNLYRCKLLDMLIYVTCYYRYYPNHPTLIFILAQWAKTLNAVSNVEQLIQLLIVSCSTQTYLGKYIKFITKSVVRPAVEVPQKNEQGGGAGQPDDSSIERNDDNRYDSPPPVSFISNIMHYFVYEFEEMLFGRAEDEGPHSTVLPAFIEACIAVLSEYRKNIGKERRSALSLLCFLTGILRKIHTEPNIAECLRKLFVAVKPFYAVSRPVGNTADWLLAELRASIPVPLFPDTSLRTWYYSRVLNPESPSRRNIHILANFKSADIRKLEAMELTRVAFHVPSKQVKGDDPDYDIIGFQANIVISMIGKIEIGLLEEMELTIVVKKPKRVLAKYYNQIMEIIEAACDKSDDALVVKNGVDTAIASLIRSKIIQDEEFEHEPVELEQENAPQRQDYASTSEYESHFNEFRWNAILGNRKSPMRRHFAPSLPWMDVELHGLFHEPVEKYLGQTTNGKAKFPIYDDYMKELKSIIKAEEELQNDETKRIDIVIAGGSATFNRFLTAYCALMNDNKTLASYDFRIYVLPFGSTSSVARYLAKYDPWYYTVVHSPFTLQAHRDLKYAAGRDQIAQTESQILRSYSTISSQSSSPSMRSFGGVTNDSNLLRYCLQNYVSNATFAKQLRIYKVDCFSKSELYMYSVPMCQRLDIGVLPHTHEAHIKTERRVEVDGFDEETGTLEQPEDTGFKLRNSASWKGVPGKLRFQQHSPVTEPEDNFNITLNGIWDNICLKNISKEGDRGPIADPESPFVELWVSGHEDANIAAEIFSLGLSAGFKRKRRLADLGDHYRVTWKGFDDAFIFSSEADFRLIVDGELYGPVGKVIVKPLLNPEVDELAMANPRSPTYSNFGESATSFAPTVMDSQMTVPVMCFTEVTTLL